MGVVQHEVTRDRYEEQEEEIKQDTYLIKLLSSLLDGQVSTQACITVCI